MSVEHTHGTMSSDTNSSELEPFPHDERSAQKTARAGVVTCNDLISEDAYHIMTRQSANDVVAHSTKMYSLDEDTLSLVESARSETTVGTNGAASTTLSLLQTDSVTGRRIDDVMSASSAETTFTAHAPDNSSVSKARFTLEGLKWDEKTSAIYIGGDTFRIQYCAGDASNNNVQSLRIQARHPVLGGYVTKWEVDNDI